ncbi:hypothetical protein P879_06946 [Paragonimus westermani]|uniref:Uncharacterized protein n=1 Tax=Paragonimus westermani TaxID=34504 RepID=A0A8T0DRM5_9TREM|nr:hypothetical protein P879_06946 [Paragonimus westermani]
MDEVEAAKAKQHSLRERLAARRQQRESLLAGIVSGNRSMNRPSINLPTITKTSLESSLSSSHAISSQSLQEPGTQVISQDVKQPLNLNDRQSHPNSECSQIADVTELVTTVGVLETSVIANSDTVMPTTTPESCDLSQSISLLKKTPSDNNRTSVDSLSTHSHMPQTVVPTSRAAEGRSKRRFTSEAATKEHDTVVETKRPSNRNTAPVSLPVLHPTTGSFADSLASANKEQTCLSKLDNELEDLLGAQTAREKESKRVREEILELLNTPTAKERYLSERFRSQGG